MQEQSQTHVLSNAPTSITNDCTMLHDISSLICVYDSEDRP